MKILFFIGTLLSGGKERRLTELLSYLKSHTDFDLMLVLRRDLIDYHAFHELNIPYKLLTEKYKKGDKTLHIKFYRICKEYQPDIIHTWGSMPAFVSLLAVILLKIPHINSQITDAPPVIKKWSLQNIINKINFRFSSLILANSYAGLKVYGVDALKRSKVIYNGVNMKRFQNLPLINNIKIKYNIKTPYAVIMVASFTENKDYNLFVQLAHIVTTYRNDITFIGVGGNGNDDLIYRRVLLLAGNNEKILLPGRINDVEALINACDVGVLFSPNGEGISNAIIEYMALGKPVIANDAGGTKEIVKHQINGYLISEERPEEIASLILDLMDDKDKRTKMGNAGAKLIHDSFSLEKMGEAFKECYVNVYP